MKKNNKGFTLVELLAVIVILAIILAIAIPAVTGITTKARQDSYASNIKMIIKGLDLYVAQGNTLTAGSVTVANLATYVPGVNASDYSGSFTLSLSPTGIAGLTPATGTKFANCAITGTATYASVTVTGC